MKSWKRDKDKKKDKSGPENKYFFKEVIDQTFDASLYSPTV